MVDGDGGEWFPVEMDDETGSTQTISRARRARVAHAVEDWTRDLFDLTGRNPLLNYRDLKKGTLDLSDLDSEAVARLMRGDKITLTDIVGPDPGPPSGPEDREWKDARRDVSERLRAIHNKARTLYEERGIAVLYLAAGFVRWTRPDTAPGSTDPYAPILMSPLQIEPRGARTEYTLTTTDEPSVNEGMLFLLRDHFGLEVDPGDLLDDTDIEDPQGGGLELVDRVRRRLERLCEKVDGFATDSRLVVGTFSYHTLPMVRDLRDNVDALAGHDLVAALAGDESARSVLRADIVHVPVDLPDRIPAADEYLVLDADSSQNCAINMALAEQSLVIEGPPGTGKSQTIANLIAAGMARGWQILFVAEKRAAIDAVIKRLDQVGLGGLVLDLHGVKVTKRELAERVKSALDRHSSALPPSAAQTHRRLEKARADLTAHRNAVHEERSPWRVSHHRAVGELLAVGKRLPGVDGVNLGPEAVLVPVERFEELVEACGEWAASGRSLLDGSSPWSGTVIDNDDDVDAALEAVELLGSRVPALRDSAGRHARASGLPIPTTVTAARTQLDLRRRVDDLAGSVDPVAIWSLDLDELENELLAGDKGPIGRLLAAMTDSRYRRAKQALRPLWRRTRRPGGRAALLAVRRARSLLDDWRRLAPGEDPVPDVDAGDLAATLDEMTPALELLGRSFPERDLTEMTFVELGEWLDALDDDHVTANRLSHLARQREQLVESGLRPIVEAAERGDVAPDQVADLVRLSWWQKVERRIRRDEATLAAFDGQRQREVLDTFRESDRRHIETNAERVARRVAEAATRARDEHPEQDRILQSEVRKKRPKLGPRKLSEVTGPVLRSVLPCWTMSPLLVAQTLPPASIFDLVIFDEASQITPKPSVGPLLWVRVAVVTGAERQLPPTRFFETAAADADDGEDDDELDDHRGFESVLAQLGGLLPRRPLTWHYRSRDEKLIAFSNREIYDGSLTTFPSALDGDCLDFVLVGGTGDGRTTATNRAEVRHVVELMLEHARERPDESLGVIAMGLRHANQIDDELNRRLTSGEVPAGVIEWFENQEVDERPFIKSIEQVQGDERDAIILTVGYCKTPDGRLPHRFGPINQEGGERRINVAVTRARRRMLVVSTITHLDIDPERSSARGVEVLRNFLRYAQSRGRELDTTRGGAELNPFESDVRERLEREGLKLHPQYGVAGYRIDFAVEHPDRPGEFVLAIEADGASYHSSPTARDRDRLRQENLERLGWRFHRIWSTHWFNDREGAVAEVMRAYAEALRGGVGGGSVDRRPSATTRPAGVTRRRASTARRESATVREPKPIDRYSDHQLVKIARGILSDGRLRTRAELIDALVEELGYRRRGRRIMERLTRVADRVLANPSN